MIIEFIDNVVDNGTFQEQKGNETRDDVKLKIFFYFLKSMINKKGNVQRTKWKMKQKVFKFSV